MKQILRSVLGFLFLFLVFITCSKDDPIPTPTYTLSASANPVDGGTISPASGTYEEGETVTLTATPSTNFVFKDWVGGASGTENPITVTFNANKIITAVFEEVAPTYTNGEGVIGALGGTVMVEDESSPLNGISLVIPEGALETKVNIKISKGDNDMIFPYDESLKLFKMEPAGLNFIFPVTIKLPYKESYQDTINLVGINYLPETKEVFEMEKISIDTNSKSITFKTEHFSLFGTWKKEILFNPDITYGNITDVDGNNYKTVDIGTQTWMAENLRTTKYSDGQDIRFVSNNAEWVSLVALGDYNNIGIYSNIYDDDSYTTTFGRLYNFYVLDNGKEICPMGWHVPNDNDWKTLEINLGMSQDEADGTGWRGVDEGGKLKEVGTINWAGKNEGATNSSGFTAIGSGLRGYTDGEFLELGIQAWFLSSRVTKTSPPWFRFIGRQNSKIYRMNISKNNGYCVRCVKN